MVALSYLDKSKYFALNMQKELNLALHLSFRFHCNNGTKKNCWNLFLRGVEIWETSIAEFLRPAKCVYPNIYRFETYKTIPDLSDIFDLICADKSCLSCLLC
jgi:hypothetical protein